MLSHDKSPADQVRQHMYNNRLLTFAGLFVLVFISYASYLRATWGLHVEAIFLCIFGSIIVAGCSAWKLSNLYNTCTSPIVAIISSSGFIAFLGVSAAMISSYFVGNA